MASFLDSFALAASLLAGGASPVGATGQPVLADRAGLVLQTIHDGRFDEAEMLLAQREQGLSETRTAFFRSLIAYWRLLYSPDEKSLQDEMERRAERVLDLAASRRSSGPGESVAEARLWAGTARLFLAELRGRQRRPLSAASQAGKARRQLEAALEADPSLADAGFGLGTHQLLASRLPTIAKGIGSLFGVTGKHEEGMTLLEQAAKKGRDLRFESRVFLIAALASRHERLYTDALGHVAGLLAEFPDAVLALDAAARVEMDLGRSVAARRHVEAALARCRESPGGTDPVVTSSLRFLRARVEFFAFRQDLALEDLERAARPGVSLPEDLRKNVLQLARHAAALVPSPPFWPARLAREWNDVSPRTLDFARAYSAEADSWASALAALELERNGLPSASAEALLALARSHPEDPVLSLLVGRALVLAGNGRDAAPWLGTAARSTRLPAPWRGICLLLGGQASDLAGDRASALAYYRQASEVPGFREDEAAVFYQQVPYRNEP